MRSMDEQETISGDSVSAPLPSRDSDGSSHSTVERFAVSRRRWYQFTVRAILAMILFAGLLLTAWCIYSASYRLQAEAADLIERLGGTYQADAALAWMSRLAVFAMQDITL